MLGLNTARRAGLLGGTALALIAAFSGSRAIALDECGPANPGDTVTCTPAGNSFPDGIQYKVNDLTVVIQDGVVIDTTGASKPGISTGNAGGNYGDLTIKAGTTAGGGVTITTDGANSDAIYAGSKDGDIVITGIGDLTTNGVFSSGIETTTDGGSIDIDWAGDIDTVAAYSTGISAITNFATGSVTITAQGDISVDGVGSAGIVASAGSTARIVSTGDIATTNEDGIGISAYSKNGGAQVYSTGDITTLGKDAGGLKAFGETSAGIFSAGNITTSGNNSVGIYVQSNDGIAVAQSNGAIATSGKYSSGMIVVGKGDTEVHARATGSIATTGYASVAIGATSATGDIEITSNARLSTAGVYANGIGAYSDSGAIRISHTGDITTKSNAADGIIAATKGNITIVSVADISIGGVANGILAYSTDGRIQVDSTGDIVTAKDNSDAINVFSKTKDVIVDSIGSIVTSGDGADGISAQGPYGATITSIGNITTSGDYAAGLFVSASGDVARIYNTGNIATSGDNANAIAAYGGGYARVISIGNISTKADETEAIVAISETDDVEVRVSGALSTKGVEADGIFAYAQKDSVEIVTQGLIQVTGAESVGINARGENDIEIDAENVLATGKDGYAIAAFSSDSTVSVTVRGTVLGGYDDAAGVYLEGDKGSSLRIEAGAVVGALNDFAVEQYIDDLTANNFGALVGGFYFNAGADQLFNTESGLVDLRQFADLDGDQVRDEEGVAFGNFGADTDTFINDGTLRLAGVAGATKWNTTDQILHPGGGNSDITQAGIEQGFITQLESFSHSGLITLSDGVAGDLLVITDQADGKTKGANVFTSDGGALALDVVLDDGSSKQSDVLILDKAETAAGGATRVLISNAGGIGGQTTGDGIMVVNVRDKSDADAFALGNTPVAGAYQYDLHYQNAAKTDENWYLRSSFFDGSLEYPAIVSGALVTWYSGLDGLHDRLGARRAEVQDGQLAALPTATDMADSSTVRVNGSGDGGWFKVTGSDMDIEQDGPADFDLNSTRATAGFDVGLNDIFGGEDWLVLGAMAGYGWSSVGFEGGSSADFDIATIGAYATYFRGPYYLDALVKFDWLDGNFHSEFAGDDIELPVFGLSLETGYRFDLNPGGLYLQPQAQLSYAHSGGDSFQDDSGARIDLDDADSLRGRIGARLGQELATTSGARAEPVTGNFYLEASVNQEFLGESEARVTGVTLEQELPETTFEIGGGIDIALPKQGVTLSFDADYILGDEAEGISATGGLRINW